MSITGPETPSPAHSGRSLHSPSTTTTATAARGVPALSYDPPHAPVPPAPVASELALHLLVSIAVDNLLHTPNGASVTDMILGSGLDIASLSTLGPARQLLNALTLERLQTSFRVSFCRALLMRVLQVRYYMYGLHMYVCVLLCLSCYHCLLNDTKD